MKDKLFLLASVISVIVVLFLFSESKKRVNSSNKSLKQHVHSINKKIAVNLLKPNEGLKSKIKLQPITKTSIHKPIFLNQFSRHKSQNFHPKLSISTSLSTQSNAYQSNSIYHQSSSTLNFKFSYQITKNYSASLMVGGSQRHTKNTETSFNNTLIALKPKSTRINPYLILQPKFAGVLATNNALRKSTSFLDSIGGSLNLIYKIALFGSPIDFIYSASYKRNIHKFSRSAIDTPNIMQNFKNIITVSRPFTKDFSFTFSGGLIFTESYQHSIRNFYMFVQNIGYHVTKKTSLDIGISNYADLFELDGQPQNLAFFNERSSTFFGSIQHIF